VVEQLGFGLAGKTAVVTGASSGIGAGIAEGMGQAGASVVAGGRDTDRLEAIVGRLGATGAECRAVVADVCTEEGRRAIVEEAIGAYGSLDILVHSAGIFWPKPFEETSADDLDRQLDTNVRAPYLLTQLAMPHLKPSGSVIFISSIAAYVGFPNASAYCATKGAVELLAKALTMEYGREGVRFNCIAPGNIRTPMNDHLFADPDYEKLMLDFTPSGRVGVAEEIAPAAVYLASDAARYVYGASLLVDGGWVAQ
jgi:NAD(P)-dependent dehydrogenase (short-subunit alcohol dehydrogenase family)